MNATPPARRLLRSVLVVLAALAPAGCHSTQATPLEDVLCWGRLEAEFESGQPGRRVYSLSKRSAARIDLPDVGVAGCASCVRAQWQFGSEPSTEGRIVDGSAPVALEIRYSGELRVGSFQYQLTLQRGGRVLRRVPLDVQVEGLLGTSSHEVVRSTVSGSHFPVRFSLGVASSELALLGVASGGSGSGPLLTTTERDATGKTEVWVSPVEPWGILALGSLRMGERVGVSPPPVRVRVNGLPLLDIVVSKARDSAPVSVQFSSRSMREAWIEARWDSPGGEVKRRVFLSALGCAVVPLDGALCCAGSSLRVRCDPRAFDRVLPLGP